MKKNKFLPRMIALSGLATLLLSSCAQNNPETRIENNPSLFSKLPNSHQDLVKQGKITEGMHKDGVILAWGKPTGVSEGTRNGKSFEKWVYSKAVPVYHGGFYPRFGYGWGSGRYRRGGYYGIGYEPVRYVSRTAATVDFNRYDKVNNWEARR